ERLDHPDGRMASAQVLAFRRLDLDDGRPGHGQQESRIRAVVDLGKVQHDKACQRRWSLMGHTGVFRKWSAVWRRLGESMKNVSGRRSLVRIEPQTLNVGGELVSCSLNLFRVFLQGTLVRFE